jgi:outer membrane protein OmpA-like peptidoglycan-associated protein
MITMDANRGSSSTLHLQMGQEVMYLLLVTSLILSFVLAALALRGSKQVSELNAARPYSETLSKNKQLKQEQVQLQNQIKNLQVVLDQLKAEQTRTLAQNQTLEESVKRAEGESAEAVARQRQAEEKNKLLEASLRQPLSQRVSQNQPPIITLREADGFSFSPGSAEISPDFLSKLAREIVPKLAALSDIHGAQVVEVIGHTDGTSVRDTLRLKANLDDSLGQYLDLTTPVALVPYDNVGLGFSRAVSVARALRTAGLSPKLDIQPLSAAYLVSPEDHASPAARHIGDAARRRIEIRIRRINAN